jgi:hypothetical protein
LCLLVNFWSFHNHFYSAAFGITGGIIYFTVFVELVFALEIILSKYSFNYILDFVTEYWGEDYFYPVRDLRKIALRYLK